MTTGCGGSVSLPVAVLWLYTPLQQDITPTQISLGSGLTVTPLKCHVASINGWKKPL